MGDRKLVDEALNGWRTSRLSEPEKGLLDFIDKLNGRPASVGEEDIQRLRGLGWDDEAIYDAVMVCGLFNFYNRWVDGCGVHGMTDEGYAASGKRLATLGYNTSDRTGT